jgi:hypothetical protein
MTELLEVVNIYFLEKAGVPIFRLFPYLNNVVLAKYSRVQKLI